MKIYEPKGRAREYSPLALNYFKGCDHGCLYCYVPRMMNQFNPEYDHSKVSCNLNLIELERSILSLSKEDRQKQILLSFTGDPYCNAENGETAKVLEVLLKYQCHTAILTKNPGKALKDIELFRKFNHFKIGTTLVFDNEKQCKGWEPGAPQSSERIQVLKQFAESGIKTFVSFEPVIIPDQSLNLMSSIPFIDHVKVGKLNQYKRLDKNINWQMFLKKSVEHLRERKVKFYIKKDLSIFGGIELTENETNPDFLNI